MDVIEEESHRKWVGSDFAGPVVNNPFSNAAGQGQPLVGEDPTCQRATKPIPPQLLSSHATATEARFP